MRKITKDLTAVPPSLNSEKTKKARDSVIAKEKYPTGKQSKTFNQRYKEEDTKNSLLEIYHKKCAYCEKPIGDSHFQVEHYRPKSIYYWLAYSWDNLLLCCDRCNNFKRDHFTVAAAGPVALEKNEETMARIHALCGQYNELEKPSMVHPEMEDVEEKLIFQPETGHVESRDPRCQYTIDTCRLDRPEANGNRQKIRDDFFKDIQAVLYEISLCRENSPASKQRRREQRAILKFLVKNFKESAQDPDQSYLAFRRYMIRNHDLFTLL